MNDKRSYYHVTMYRLWLGEEDNPDGVYEERRVMVKAFSPAQARMKAELFQPTWDAGEVIIGSRVYSEFIESRRVPA